jgi:hypothetical protein
MQCPRHALQRKDAAIAAEQKSAADKAKAADEARRNRANQLGSHVSEVGVAPLRRWCAVAHRNEVQAKADVEAEQETHRAKVEDLYHRQYERDLKEKVRPSLYLRHAPRVLLFEGL